MSEEPQGGSRLVDPQEKQREVRAFVTDTIKETIGKTTQLNTWVAGSIHEKLVQDITNFYPGFGKRGADLVKEVAEKSSEEHNGLLYLHRNQTIVLVKVISRRVIDFIKASVHVHPDRDSAQRIASELSARGLECSASAVAYIPFDSNNAEDLHLEAYHPDSALEERTRAYTLALIQATITQSSARDVQKLPGPSDLANTCDQCLAQRLASALGVTMSQTAQNFSLKAWLGTAMHQKLEVGLPGVYPYAQQEITVPIETVPYLGSVKGHVDAFFPKKKTMADWKSTDMKKLEKIMKLGVPWSHFGQTMLYMYGLKKSGRECDYATLAYIPRDSSDASNIWVASCEYREDVAVGLLNRTRSLIDRLKGGDVGSLKSDPDCFVCHVQHRIRR